MAEGNGLLNRHTLSRRIEGSNPSVSAIHLPARRRRCELVWHRTAARISAPSLPSDSIPLRTLQMRKKHEMHSWQRLVGNNPIVRAEPNFDGLENWRQIVHCFSLHCLRSREPAKRFQVHIPRESSRSGTQTTGNLATARRFLSCQREEASGLRELLDIRRR